jgi:6-phosphofructokinase
MTYLIQLENDTNPDNKQVNEAAEESGYDLRMVSVPKTVDNDLVIDLATGAWRPGP